MTQATAIEWTDRSSNPIRFRDKRTGKTGWHCHKISPGCAHCYSERMDHRLGLDVPYQQRYAEFIEAYVNEKELASLLKLKDHQKVFLGDMTDLFLDLIPDAMLDRVFAAILATPRVTYQILTKRPERAARYFRRSNQWGAAEAYRDLVYGPDSDVSLGDGLAAWPPRNVWLGVSVEDQARADERIPLLLQTPAAARFLSIEPLLGPVDLDRWIGRQETDGGIHLPYAPPFDWVIVGGESGPKARPMHPDWARSIRDQCVAAGVAFHFKQWGEWAPASLFPDGIPSGTSYCFDDLPLGHADEPWKVGKKVAGRMLDGREWNELPTASRTLGSRPATRDT